MRAAFVQRVEPKTNHPACPLLPVTLALSAGQEKSLNMAFQTHSSLTSPASTIPLCLNAHFSWRALTLSP